MDKCFVFSIRRGSVGLQNRPRIALETFRRALPANDRASVEVGDRLEDGA
jgi:hypothetical protein